VAFSRPTRLAEKEPKFRDNAISYDLKGTFGSSAAALKGLIRASINDKYNFECRIQRLANSIKY
jgi:hypothetical protein